MGTLGVLHFMLFDQACEEARNKSDPFEKAGYPG